MCLSCNHYKTMQLYFLSNHIPTKAKFISLFLHYHAKTDHQKIDSLSLNLLTSVLISRNFHLSFIKFNHIYLRFFCKNSGILIDFSSTLLSGVRGLCIPVKGLGATPGVPLNLISPEIGLVEGGIGVLPVG